VGGLGGRGGAGKVDRRTTSCSIGTQVINVAIKNWRISY